MVGGGVGICAAVLVKESLISHITGHADWPCFSIHVYNSFSCEKDLCLVISVGKRIFNIISWDVFICFLGLEGSSGSRGFDLTPCKHPIRKYIFHLNLVMVV